MAIVKIYKKGESLFKENEKILHIQMIQSGGVSLFLQRGKKMIDLFQVGPSQLLGELYLSGMAIYNYSAVATTETKVLEMPIEEFKQILDGGAVPAPIKLAIKSLADRLKMSVTEVRSAKMEKDSSPCPEEFVAKVFGVIFHTIKHKGVADEKNKNKVSIEWSQMRQYAQRIFGESLKRLEQATSVLVKMKLAEFEMGKAPDNPDGPDEIQRVHCHDLPAIEAFFEFFQYYYFKGVGKSDVLKFDESIYFLLSQFIKLAEPLQADRFGVVSMDYTKLVEAFKADLGINLNNDHFTRLEQKGIFAKRAPRQDGSVVLQFELNEFKTTQKIWRILREIEKWNEKGFVDMNEDDLNKARKKVASGSGCPQCGADLGSASAKFCPECGAKLTGTAGSGGAAAA